MRENSGIEMTLQKTIGDIENNPTLHDVLLVEKAVQDHNESIVTLPQLKKLLQGKINEDKIYIILDYLEEENRIVVSPRGITWIKNTQLKVKILNALLEKSKLTEKDSIILGNKIKREIAKKHGLVKNHEREKDFRKKQREMDAA
ncbi:MAG: hypothetical protein V1726_01095 [Methanobacteriota archaeon]